MRRCETYQEDPMNKAQLNELLYQALETEMGGLQVYTTALECVINDDLKEEWQKYLDQTKNHEQVVRNLFGKLGLDPEEETPGRAVVRHLGKGLVKAMKMAQQAGHPEEAELVVSAWSWPKPRII